MDFDLVVLILIIPFILVIFTLARSLSVLFHELGHAIPAMIFTKKKVTIFLGSYGNEAISKKVNIAERLGIYFFPNPLKWRLGIVKHDSVGNSIVKQLIILFLGPLFSFLIAFIAFRIVFSFDLNGFIKLSAIIFLVSALFDLRNLYPQKEAIELFDGTLTYNDGQQIKRVIKFRKDKKKLSRAYEFYNEGNYKSTIDLFQNLNPELINNSILYLIASSFIKLKQYNKAKEYYSKYLDLPLNHKPDADNLCNFGVIESWLGNDELAMSYYEKAIEWDNNHIYSLANRGYALNLSENYNEALKDFDAAIKVDPNFSYAYANRAYSKIKLKQFYEALADINKALVINEKESYAYRSLGIYYLEIDDYISAVEQLQIAFQLDPDTHSITDYISIAKERLSCQ